MVRALYRPGRDPLPDGDGLPPPGHPASQEVHQEIGDFLSDPANGRIARPLHADDNQYSELVNERLRTMTLVERIDIEIDLTQRFRCAHSFDYDPLRW
jgi:hypothetical protein